MAAFFIPLRQATVSATVPPARAQRTHTLRHTRHTPLPSHGARPREQRPRRPARHGIRTILPAFPHKAQDTRHTLRTPHLVPEYALYDKAARIAAGGFRFSRRASPRGTTLPGDPLILRRPHSFPENPDPSPESLLFGKALRLEADIRAVGRHQVCPRRLTPCASPAPARPAAP